MDSPLHRHVFEFNPQDNSGESVTLTTDFFHNGDPGEKGIYLNQEFSLQSYYNSAAFVLIGCTLTPALLRQLADELDRAQTEALNKLTRKGQDGTLAQTD